jgi:hypothetical protein
MGCSLSVEEIEEITITPEDIKRCKKRILEGFEDYKK